MHAPVLPRMGDLVIVIFVSAKGDKRPNGWALLQRNTIASIARGVSSEIGSVGADVTATWVQELWVREIECQSVLAT